MTTRTAARRSTSRPPAPPAGRPEWLELSPLETVEYARRGLFDAILAAEAIARGENFEPSLAAEVSSAARRRFDLPDRPGIVVPWQALAGATSNPGIPGGVQTGENIPGPIAPAWSRSLIARLGVELLPGIAGQASVPLPIGAASVPLAWMNDWADDAEAADVDVALNVLELSPRAVGVRIPVSRRLRKQAPVLVNAWLRRELTNAAAAAMDYALLAGAGGLVEPMGLVHHPAVDAVALGTDGGPLTYDKLVEALGVLGAAANERGLALVCTNSVRTSALTTRESAADPSPWLWTAPRVPGADGAVLAGAIPAFVSPELPEDLTKGSGTNLSGAVMGRWQDATIALWGPGFEVVADTSTNIKSGGLVLQLIVDLDAGTRRPDSFVRFVDIATA